MKTQFQHIKHLLKNIPEKGFFILNEFKSDLSNGTLEDVLDSDLLNEGFFSTEEQKIQTQKQLDQLRIGAFRENVKEQDEVYGPLLKNEIGPSDFAKMDYNSFLLKMQSYLSQWTDNGWINLVDGLRAFHHFALEQLEDESADKGNFYFLDADSVDKNKLCEVNLYDYFFTVIFISEDSNKVFIFNFGND